MPLRDDAPTEGTGFDRGPPVARGHVRDPRVRRALGDKDWLEGRFTVGDLMMVDAPRNLSADQLSIPQTLIDYRARGEARPAFQAALAAQLADFAADPEGVPA